MTKQWMRSLAIAGFCSGGAAGAGAQVWAPIEAGKSLGAVRGGGASLWNQAMEVRWRFGSSPEFSLRNRWDGTTVDVSSEPFAVELSNGTTLNPSKMLLVSGPVVVPVHGDHKAQRKADWEGGVEVKAVWSDPRSGLTVGWRGILRSGADYIRTEVSLTPSGRDVDAKRVVLVQLPVGNGHVVGTVPGSPVVAGDDFFGFEHPMSVSSADEAAIECGLNRKLPLKAGQTVTYSAVFGVAPPTQVRRAFQYYVEQERARPYKPFLHYNSWYDLGEFGRYTAAQCVDRINAFGKTLSQERHVKLSSFLFDDGWDDPDTTWKFNSDFPNALTPLTQAAAKYGAGPGMWLSPWGGYADPRQHRLAAARKGGFEIDSQGLALSGPKYYQRFRDVTLQMVTQYGVNQFKFDGTGSPDKQYPGSRFDSDFDAAIQLIGELRKAKPGLFVNLTTGTWPSPFWTRYADSTWRGGYDHNFAGVGPDRERWITYRDGDTYNGVVKRGPLYPINSLMLHGMIYAQYADRLKTDPNGVFRHEVRSYFGTGTQLQEMYITPSLLSRQNWDDLAQSAAWSQANANVLRDVHWVGGDPMKLDVYGWAAWSPRKAILVLRNPSDEKQAISIDARRDFEIPPLSNPVWTVRSVYPDQPFSPTELVLGQSKEIVLAPFQVLALEVRPK